MGYDTHLPEHRIVADRAQLDLRQSAAADHGGSGDFDRPDRGESRRLVPGLIEPECPACPGYLDQRLLDGNHPPGKAHLAQREYQEARFDDLGPHGRPVGYLDQASHHGQVRGSEGDGPSLAGEIEQAEGIPCDSGLHGIEPGNSDFHGKKRKVGLGDLDLRSHSLCGRAQLDPMPRGGISFSGRRRGENHERQEGGYSNKRFRPKCDLHHLPPFLVNTLSFRYKDYRPR